MSWAAADAVEVSPRLDGCLREEPSFAHSLYSETVVAGSRAVASFERCQRWFAGFIRSWREAAGPVDPPIPAFLAVTDATNEAVRRTLCDGGDLLALEGAVMYIHRALLGPRRLRLPTGTRLCRLPR
ncbi:hypothetical protein IU427_23605 [Nocardia beijingensis]|uniref:hypothetical protein n=1 Tax=Nocardia beijingensis TaxID=95162 RepID=UPI00189567DE|nr:hypothetical protein [Nocardia beijingensis]MBF6468149.1 hypothetical protein [Nocardia beijingensis]